MGCKVARIEFTPSTVATKGKSLTLTEDGGTTLTLKMPSKDCAQMVFATLLHNFPKGDEK